VIVALLIRLSSEALSTELAESAYAINRRAGSVFTCGSYYHDILTKAQKKTVDFTLETLPMSKDVIALRQLGKGTCEAGRVRVAS
jgi:hypothetical protein